MTERKKLKRKLSKLKYYRKMLPHYIDLGNVYGDGSFDQSDIEKADKEIKELEQLIAKLPCTT